MKANIFPVRRFTTALVAVVLLLVSALPVAAAPLAQTNLVKNPSFEGGFTAVDSVGNIRQPDNWENFKISGGTMHYEREAHPSHVRSGGASARYFTAWENHNAGLRQKVSGLTPGATYRLTGYVFMWSSEEGVVDTPSDATMTGWVGVDSTGGKDPTSSNVKWSSGTTSMDGFQMLTVDFVPTTADAWIFLRTQTSFPMTRNDAFWDDISVTLVSSTGVTTTPGATAQPTSSTGTGGTAVRATADAQGRIIHTVVAGDTLSGIAFLYGVPMTQIQELNGMTSTVVLLGQQLIISNGTVAPTAAPTSAETPTPAATATPEVTATPTQPAPGKLCVISFLDANGNGFREPDEVGAAGIAFTLSEGEAVLSNSTTDAMGSLCFDMLAPANYTISWTGAEYTPTTDQKWSAAVTSGVTLNHEFGLQSGGAAAESAEPDDAPSGGLPRWLVAVLGAFGAILLLAGLGAGGYYLLAKRTKVS